MGKLPDQLQAEALEFVLFNQFVQIDAEQLERDALVLAEVEVVQHVHDVVSGIIIRFSRRVCRW